MGKNNKNKKKTTAATNVNDPDSMKVSWTAQTDKLITGSREPSLYGRKLRRSHQLLYKGDWTIWLKRYIFLQQ